MLDDGRAAGLVIAGWVGAKRRRSSRPAAAPRNLIAYRPLPDGFEANLGRTTRAILGLKPMADPCSSRQ
jgi:hypothetical protein